MTDFQTIGKVDSAQQVTQAKPFIHSFGEPEAVMDSRTLFEYGYCPTYQKWYEYPYDIDGISKLYRATSHHTSALVTKKNIITSLFVPHAKLSRREFESLIQNLLVFSNGYLQVIRDGLGNLKRIKSRLAKNTRRGTNVDLYYHVNYHSEAVPFKKNEIIHIYNQDIDQELYGVPDYISSINSILLNEAATLFRRRYYKNGAHAGYILYMSDALTTQDDVDKLETAVEESKGAGNFKNMFMYMPNGNPDSVKVIPLAEVAAKDEFANIKIASRDDQLAGHRIPPQLMGIVPSNTGGFGDGKKAAEIFYYNEILPILNMLTDINAELGEEVIKFTEYELAKSEVPNK